MNKRFSFASASVFIFALSGQINAQIAEPVQPGAEVPAVESPAPEPAPNLAQPAPQAPAWPAQVSQAQAAPVQGASANDQSLASEEDLSKSHELKLDIVYALFDALKIGYEYTLSYRNALALNWQYSFSKKSPEIKMQALASYKLYIVRPKKGPWFFVETSAGYTQGYYDYQDDWNYYDEKKKYDAFTVGLSGGLKFYVPSTDVGLETIVGFSRPYGVYSNEDESMESMYWLPLLSANLIKRF